MNRSSALASMSPGEGDGCSLLVVERLGQFPRLQSGTKWTLSSSYSAEASSGVPNEVPIRLEEVRAERRLETML